MSREFKQRGQILIIYLTSLFIGGSSLAVGMLATGKTIKDLEKGVKSHVTEPERQEKALSLLEQWGKEGKQLQKTYKAQRETLLDLIKQYDAEKSSFQSSIREAVTTDSSTSKRLLDIQYALRENMTKKEWDRVFGN